MVDIDKIKCLTISERSQYHSYRQDVFVTEVVDLDGELLSENRIDYEEDVRDEWMTDFKTIRNEKDYVRVFSKDGTEFHAVAKDTDRIYLTNAEAASYQKYTLDDPFKLEFAQSLVGLGMQVTSSSSLVTGTHPLETVVYDHDIKAIFSTGYDSMGRKIREVAMEFEIMENGDYAPVLETHLEWILTENGCCVRKVTTITRMGFTREHVPVSGSGSNSEAETSSSKPSLSKDERYLISSIPQTASFGVGLYLCPI